MQQQKKVIKLFLPGEALERKVVFTTESGEVLEYDVKRKILVPSKKNSKDIVTNKTTGKSFLIPSKHYQHWEKEHKSLFEKFYTDLFNNGTRLPITRCDIRMLFYYPDSKERDNHNKFETLADMMQDAGIIANDSFKVFNEQSMKGRVCRQRPRTEIYITIIEADDLKAYEWDITSKEYHASQKKKRALQNKISRHIRNSAARR